MPAVPPRLRRPRRPLVARAAASAVLACLVLRTAGGRPILNAAAPDQTPHASPPQPALFATAPGAVITTTMAVTNTFDSPHVFNLEIEPGAADSWPLSFAPAHALAAGASARFPVTVSVPIAAVDGQSTRARILVRARGNAGTRGWVAERTLYAWTGGDMNIDRYVGCRGDLDGTGTVDDADLGRVAAAFDARAGEAGFAAAIDFDHDGRIGAADVQAIAGRLGRACGPPAGADSADSTVLRRAVTLDALRGHLEALQGIADGNGGHRAIGSPGYAQSVAYARAQLEAVGYTVDVRPFTYPGHRSPPPATFALLAPETRAFVLGTDFVQSSLSGSGDVTATVTAVDVVVPPPAAANGSTSGCEAADFAAFPAGAIALVQRGTCPFDDKLRHAVAAGAAAVVVFNEGQDNRTAVFDVTLRAEASVPVLGAGFAVGEAMVAQLRAGTAVRAHIKTESATVDLPGQSVIAEWPKSEDDGVVMIGGHLDSVTAGPGINDDGSGVAAVLEIARQVARLDATPRHRLRFALWGGEELGLWGSRRYVEALPPDERARLLAYLNFDMIASPNPIRGLYDSLPESDGADQIEDLFARWFDLLGVPHEKATIVTGRSDHAYFSAAGIPVGGLFTGLNQAMSPAQAERYRGTAGALMDPCYHQRCDTIANIHWPMFDEMADAVAHATWTLANDPLFPLTSGRARPMPALLPVASTGPAVAAPPGADTRATAIDPAAAGARPGADVVPAPPTLRPRSIVLAPRVPRLHLRPDAVIAQSDGSEIAVLVQAVAGMAAYEATLHYDPSAVRILGIERGDFLAPGQFVLGPTGAAGTLALGAASAAAASDSTASPSTAVASTTVTGTGRVATVRFQRLRGPQPPRLRVEQAATGTFDAAGVRLGPPAAVRFEGALVESAWLPWGGR
ncbi:MAG: M20/M25/M40 family metallo-hydrolase [Ardenticatenales bacterium]|nr:M20/M25/M40 family metallo-hydrolase [Ardenticatenales bacterium]